MSKKLFGSVVAAAILSSGIIGNFAISSEAYACNDGLGQFDLTCRGRIFGPPAKPTQSTSGCSHCSYPKPVPVTITNRTGATIAYSLNGENFTLAPGYLRTHQTTNQTPGIAFDSSFDYGYQAKGYTLNAYGNYAFQSSGAYVDLYRQ